MREYLWKLTSFGDSTFESIEFLYHCNLFIRPCYIEGVVETSVERREAEALNQIHPSFSQLFVRKRFFQFYFDRILCKFRKQTLYLHLHQHLQMKSQPLCAFVQIGRKFQTLVMIWLQQQEKETHKRPTYNYEIGQ